ncbi:MAG: precorrin-8X methylmutase [Deltaproteobacteria bacterium]|nr:precorrin-8X methylmutase [Deltaproteobacteria bacterium]
MTNFDPALFGKIAWEMSGAEIEAASFRRIEAELPDRAGLPPAQWRIARRLIHTTADFSLAARLRFGGDPVAAGLAALRAGAPIYADSMMIRSGISLAKLRRFFPGYGPERLHCYVADPRAAAAAREQGIARSLAALELAREILPGAIVLVGNAPLALAGIVRLAVTAGIRPRLVIGMPVGFVHVEEAKELLLATDIPHVVLAGRRGGSPLAVATLHAIMESGEEL